MNTQNDFWPELEYEKFKSTSHLLHMGTQIIGKFKLFTPFEPHWANIPLWLTSWGLTTGLIPYRNNSFSIDLDIFDHKVIVSTISGNRECFNIESMSVADFASKLFLILKKFKIDLVINLIPQETTDPIPFDKDTEINIYNRALAEDWWKILIKTQQVMQQYHAFFDGESPPIGFMWGTFDLRDARYNGVSVPTTGANAGYIRRNAMNEAQVEVGFWPGNALYPKPAFYSFTYPQPKGIEDSKIKPGKAFWHSSLFEFVLDYDEVRSSSTPEKDLLDFFQSTYEVGTKLANWDEKLNTQGKPI